VDVFECRHFRRIHYRFRVVKNTGNHMPRDTRKAIKRLTAQVFTCPVDVYLASEKFSDFCRNHDILDAWKQYLEISRETPELYGSAVTKNAFELFLHHIFHRRPDEFLKLFIDFLLEFLRGISCVIPVENLKKDLMDLGYSDRDLETELSVLRANEENHQEMQD
jgi:hypothetical protein